MATLLEAMTERDKPRSRNTLDDDEEDEAMMRVEGSEDKNRVVFQARGEGANALEGACIAVLCVGAPLSSLARSMFSKSLVTEIGSLVRQASSFGFSSEWPVAVAKHGDFKCVLVCGHGGELLEQEDCFEWARGALENVGDSIQRVIILAPMSRASYTSAKGDRAEPPLVRSLTVQIPEEELAQMQLERLETGNVITGVVAAALTECLWGTPRKLTTESAMMSDDSDRVKSVPAVAILTLREAHMEVDSLMACVAPLRAALAAAGGEAALVEFDTIRSMCTKIKDVRSLDREALYI